MRKVYASLRQHGFAVHNATSKRIAIHGHDYLEFAYVEKGAMVHIIDGKETILRAGDYFIVDHGIKHSYAQVSEEALLVRNFLFYSKFLDPGLVTAKSFQELMNSYLLRFCYQTLKESPTGITFHDTDGRIRSVLDEISGEYEEEGYGYMEYIRCAFVKVLILTMRTIERKENPLQKSNVVAQMVRRAEEGFKEKLRLSTLATELGYNASYLSQKFSGEMGIGFMEYLHRVRIGRSCHLLETTDMKISRIAQEVGYDGVKYFNRIFKNQLSVTPKEFRAMYNLNR